MTEVHEVQVQGGKKNERRAGPDLAKAPHGRSVEDLKTVQLGADASPTETVVGLHIAGGAVPAGVSETSRALLLSGGDEAETEEGSADSSVGQA